MFPRSSSHQKVKWITFQVGQYVERYELIKDKIRLVQLIQPAEPVEIALISNKNINENNPNNNEEPKKLTIESIYNPSDIEFFENNIFD